MKKILFLTKLRNDSYGDNPYVNKTFGLLNSARFASQWLVSQNFESKVVSVADGNDIDREVTQYNPEMVVIEALWVAPEKLTEILKIPRHTNRIWVVRLHSKPSFIANEGMALDWIAQYIKMLPWAQLYLAPNNQEFAFDLARILHAATVYLPNIYSPESPPSFKPQKQDNGFLNIGCFGAIRPLKNHLTQALAALKLGAILNRKIRFHINCDRIEQQGDPVLRNLRQLFKNVHPGVTGTGHELIEHSWLNHDDFVSVVQTMDLGTQVSFTETFNIVVADFVYNGIPCVVSEEIYWMPDSMKVRNSTSTDEIVAIMIRGLKSYGNKTRHIALEYLNAHNQIAHDHWLKFLDQF